MRDLSSNTWVRWMARAALLTAPYFYLRPYGFDFSRGSSFSLVDLFLVPLSLLVLYTERTRIFAAIMENRLARIGFFFVTWSAFSTLVSRTIYDFDVPLNYPSAVSTFVQYSFVLVAMPLMATRFFGGMRDLVRWTAVGYLPPMLIGILLLPHERFEWLRSMFYFANRAIGTYGNANSFAFVIAIVLPLYTYLAVSDEDKRWRRLGYAGQTVSLISMFLTVSFSGYLVFFLMLLAFPFIALIREPARPAFAKVARFVAISLALTLVASAAVYAYSPSIVDDVQRRLSLRDQGPNETGLAAVGSASQRLSLMERALKKLRERGGTLLLGNGLGNTRFSPSFTIGGTHLDVHNIYLLLALEGGFVLMALFIWFLTRAYKEGREIRVGSPALSIALRFCVLALMLFGMNYPHIYLRYFWVPFLPVFFLTSERRKAG